MPLQPPNLDDRTFKSLFEEARARIPRYLPEWTDWNESDPGITLLQLQSWLAETVLYRLNQLPDLNYIKFLQLLGVEQRPARPAQADLTFLLKEEAKAKVSEIIIQKGALVGVSARDLEKPIFFETDRSLTAISSRLALLFRDAPGLAQPEDVTAGNAAGGQPYNPFGDPAVAGGALWLGFTTGLPISRQEIGLQIYLADESQALLAQPETLLCGPEVIDPSSPLTAWECWDGKQWSALDVSADETRHLTESGQVYFKTPGQIPAASLETVTGVSGLETDPPLLYWLRVRLVQGVYAKAPRIERILTNTVRATAAQTIFDEAVGSSDGSPGQVMKLRNSPVLAVSEATPPLVLEVDEGSGPRPWKQVTDFYPYGPDAEVFTLNRSTGEITFGDGRHGRIPVAGQFNVVARQYRHGQGRMGNVGANTIITLATPVPEAESVANYRPAFGGDDEESLSETRLRGPRQAIQTRDRAVTLEDYALLAQETPGALVARSYAYATQTNAGKQINVVIVPESAETRPTPSEVARRMVCQYLDARRLVTTQVIVSGPHYHDIDVFLDVRASPDADLKTVKTVLSQRLSDYLHPLRGGSVGKGWPFGRDIFYSELLREIMLTAGVLRVETLKLTKLLPRPGAQPYFDASPTASERNILLAAEQTAFPYAAAHPPSVVVIEVVIVNPDKTVTTRYYVGAAYDRSDLPVAEGALLALRMADISVSYLRNW